MRHGFRAVGAGLTGGEWQPGEGELFTYDDHVASKEVFHRYNLMSYGTVLGNGAYHGPDYTAEYLGFVAEALAGQPAERLVEVRHSSVQAGTSFCRTGGVPSTSGPGPMTKTSTYAAGPRPASPAGPFPRRPRLTASPTSSLGRLGSAWPSDRAATVSYTNNWPYEPALGNVPTPTNLLWTALTVALVLLLAALIVVAYESLRVEPIPDLPPLEPGSLPMSPAQRAVIPLFAVGAVLFLLQTLGGRPLVLAG